MDPNRKSSCATVVPPNHFKTNNSYEHSIDDVTTVTSNPTLFQKLKNTWQRHDTQFDEEKHTFNKKSILKNSRGWMAAILMILIGILIAITFILVGLGKSLTVNNDTNSTIATNSTTTTITITTTLRSTVT